MFNALPQGEPHSGSSAFDRPGLKLPVLDVHVRLVTTREKRFRRLIALDAPEIVLRNELRMLRAAVNALIKTGGTVNITVRDAACVPTDTGRRGQQRLSREPKPKTGTILDAFHETA